MNGENERIKRIEEFLLDPERALFTTLEEFRSAVSEILPILAKIDFATLETLKGEDGKTPQRGVDYMTQDDIDALEAFILSKMPVVDVDFASIESTEAFIKAELAKIPRIKGDKGEPGAPGKPGKAGSPDSGADILKKLRELGRNQGLKISDIRGLENRIKLYNTAVDELAALKQAFEEQRIVIPANTGGGSGGGTVASITAGTGIAVDSTDPTAPVVSLDAASIASLALADTALQNITGLITAGTGIQITGSGTAGDPYEIESTGGFSLTNGRGTTANGTAVDLGGTYATSVSLVSGGGGASFFIDNIGQTAIALGDVADANGGAILSVASNILSWADTALIAKFGINVLNPDTALHVVGSIKMVDGNESAGYVLTSDADGVGSWQALPASGQVDSVGAGTGISVNSTDPTAPVVSLDSASIASLALADSALQASDIGVSVQAYSSNLDTWATKTAPSGAVVGDTDTQTLSGKTLTSPIINVTSDAEGDLYYRNAGGAFTRLPIGTNGQVLTTDGSIPVWDDPSSGDPALTMIPKPEVSVSGAAASVQLNSNTTAMVGLVDIAHSITPNVIFIRKTSIGTAGNFKVALFSSDGQTKVFEETFATGTGTGLGLYQLTTPPTIPAGKYYLMILPVSTTDFSSSFCTTQNNGTTGSNSLYADGGSAYAYEGRLTVTAGTIPTTFSPGDILATNNRTLYVRFDTLAAFIYTSSGTWIAPPGVTSVLVRVWAGGGGGGGGNGQVGGGGGGGAYSEKTISVTPGNSYTVTVGAGGSGNGVSGNEGSPGGDSWFLDATTVLAKGGLGGKNDAAFCKGGLASAGIGDTKFSGGNGTQGDNGGGGGGAGTTANGGNASGSTGGTGGSLFGGNGGTGGAAGFDGTNGLPRGGGGGGGQSGAGAGASSGAAGAVEIIPQ